MIQFPEYTKNLKAIQGIAVDGVNILSFYYDNKDSANKHVAELIAEDEDYQVLIEGKIIVVQILAQGPADLAAKCLSEKLDVDLIPPVFH